MGLLVGLLFGIGAFVIWWSCWPTQPTRPRQNAVARRVDDELRLAGMDAVSPVGLLTGCLITAVVVGVATLAVSRAWPIAGCFAAIAGWSPWSLVRVRARRRRVVMRELWPEAVDHLTSGIRAGLSLPEAVSQLADRGPVPLRPAFAAFAEDYRSTGRFVECLDRLKVRLADPVADRIVEALRLTREVGGNDLGRLLRTLSAFLREDARTRAELEARQSWTVNGARLAVAAPWVVLAVLASRPEAVTAYNSATGAVVLGVGAGCCVLAYRVMVRIGRLPEEARVLR